MGVINLGGVLILGGGCLCCYWVISCASTGNPHLRPSILSLLIYLGMVIAGWKMRMSAPVSKQIDVPPVPPGFTPAYWHKNIAIDTSSGLLWIRDSSGVSRVCRKKELLWWQASSQKFGPAYEIAGAAGGKPIVFEGQQVDLRNKLIIQTTDVGHPLWAVDFNVYGAVSLELNRRDALEWANRLTAFVNS